jgi:UDP-N-acetyl-2-amino-2-deoxyglucuronate dehydrogenase
VLGAVDATKPIKWFNVSAEDMMVGTLVFENGVRANIQVGGPDKDLPTGVRVIGSEGFIEVLWDGQIGQAAVYNDPSWKPPFVQEAPDEQLIGVIRNAIDSLESGEEPELSYKKALRATEIIFAFYESVRRNARIELPLTGVTDNPFITMLDNGQFAVKA